MEKKTNTNDGTKSKFVIDKGSLVNLSLAIQERVTKREQKNVFQTSRLEKKLTEKSRTNKNISRKRLVNQIMTNTNYRQTDIKRLLDGNWLQKRPSTIQKVADQSVKKAVTQKFDRFF